MICLKCYYLQKLIHPQSMVAALVKDKKSELSKGKKYEMQKNSFEVMNLSRVPLLV